LVAEFKAGELIGNYEYQKSRRSKTERIIVVRATINYHLVYFVAVINESSRHRIFIKTMYTGPMFRKKFQAVWRGKSPKVAEIILESQELYLQLLDTPATVI